VGRTARAVANPPGAPSEGLDTVPRTTLNAFEARSRAAKAATALMLVLALAGCSTSSASITGVSALLGSSQAEQGRTVRIFVASTRKPASGEAVRGPRFNLTAVSVPPGHEPGVIERPSFTSESASRHFTVASERKLDSEAFQQAVATQLSGRVGVSRDVLVFVHGFNTGYDEARFRLAQIVADSGFTGVPVLFTWPSRNQILAYGSDKESATASRDHLEKLIEDLGAAPGVGRVHVLAHSMGTWLAMESLRQAAIGGKAQLGGHLGEVMLAAPDIDLEVFRGQMSRVGQVARVSVFAAADDRALSMSSTLAGDRTRLGALNLSDKSHLAELAGLNVRVYDLTKAKSTDMFRHGTFAEAPSVVQSIGAQLADVRIEDKAAVEQQQAQSYVDPQAMTATPYAGDGIAPARPAAVSTAPLGAPGAAPTPSTAIR
jgi:esterase/lipase superfamily enzyme